MVNKVHKLIEIVSVNIYSYWENDLGTNQTSIEILIVHFNSVEKDNVY